MKMSKGRIGRRLLGLAVAGVALAASGTAFAELGQPSPWEYKLQEAGYAGDGQHHLVPQLPALDHHHHHAVRAGAADHRVVKFNAKANPVPSRTTHNTLIEVAWTLIPVLILVGIAVPSFRLLFLELDVPKADLTIKATGKQWYWSYAYPDNGKFEFDSLLLRRDQRQVSRRACSASTTRWWCR